MLDALLKGITLGLLLSIWVGPVIFSIIKQSLNNGIRGGLAFVIGVSVSDIALVLGSNVFTEMFGYMVKHREIIGIGGSVFLITVGLYFFFLKKVKVDEGGIVLIKFRKRDYARIFLSGFFMNTLNPGVFIFWLTTSTTLVAQSIQNRIIIFSTCLALVLAGDIFKVFMAQRIRKKLTPHNLHILNKINGVILVIFGVVLLWGLIAYGHRFD